MWTDDPNADWDSYCEEEEERINKLPRCEYCGKHIQQDYALKIDDCWICDDCIHDMTIQVEEEE